MIEYKLNNFCVLECYLIMSDIDIPVIENTGIVTEPVEASGPSIGDICKKAWICFQVTMMIVQMVWGTCLYQKKIKGWSKLKTLFCVMFCLITYLCVNEFTNSNFVGIFMLLLLAQWCYFITFSMVIDSCVTIEDDQSMFSDKLKTFNFVFRALMHVSTVTLLVSVFFFNSCEENIYP